MVVLLALAGLLVYAGWLGGPYLRSVIVRDAAVTSWINRTAAPIRGQVDAHPLYPGQRVGEDGRLATIKDDLADQTPVSRAEADLQHAVDHLQAVQQTEAMLKSSVASRAVLANEYATAFKMDLDGKIAAANSKLALIKQHLALERVQADRLTKLAASGHTTQAAADAEAANVADLQRAQADIQEELDRTKLRRQDADQGALLLDDGTDGAIAARSLEEARLALSQTESDILVAKVDVDSARSLLAAAKAVYKRMRRSNVPARPGALVWSLISAPGAEVQPGMPIASWIDCSILLIDVPVSDVELALLPKDAPANVILEGERRVRHGKVLLTRGAAATIGPDDLAAIAKGRQPGVGQVLVQIEATPADIEACPVGNAAHVDFPDVGLIDVLRARLRL
jgi:hypothetical protein